MTNDKGGMDFVIGVSSLEERHSVWIAEQIMSYFKMDETFNVPMSIEVKINRLLEVKNIVLIEDFLKKMIERIAFKEGGYITFKVRSLKGNILLLTSNLFNINRDNSSQNHLNDTIKIVLELDNNE